MNTITIFEAFDGTQFTSASDCSSYEKSLLNEKEIYIGGHFVTKKDIVDTFTSVNFNENCDGCPFHPECNKLIEYMDRHAPNSFSICDVITDSEFLNNAY